MNYALNKPELSEQQKSGFSALKGLIPLLQGERKALTVAGLAILINTGSVLIGPIIIGRIIDTYIATKNERGILLSALALLCIYFIGLGASYLQIIRMGGVGRRLLFRLRNAVFTKLQELPVAFFNQNKTGDLISRINNDTDKLNQFFSQALMQFIGNFFLIVGSGVLLVSLHGRLGIAALLPAIGVLIVTQLISSWVKQKNTESLQSVGGMSAEIQESLSNFKVIVAFNRIDYFRKKFDEANQKNFSASIKAGLANNIFPPIYTLASALAQMVVVGFGVYLITHGSITVGILVTFLLYVNNFYTPLRQFASVWSSLQQALAALDRISEVQSLHSDLTITTGTTSSSQAVLEFDHVEFSYPEGKHVLTDVCFALQEGKTYAFVGPTGGGKTTTASLMARLYDPSTGTIFLHGRDIRSYTPEERSSNIGFILQEPFLFTGTLLDNIFYGNAEYAACTDTERLDILHRSGFDDLLNHLGQPLNTMVQTSGETISLGQRQLIAFMRAVLRKPTLLILDEATANIDTVTEQLLQRVLDALPKTTTKVIIAHRLNTIEDADEIFFVNDGNIIQAGTLEKAVEMLMHGTRKS